MAEVQSSQVAFLDNVRLSSYAQSIDDPGGERQRLPGHTVEDGRTYDVPGHYSDSGSIAGYVPTNAKAALLRTMPGNGETVPWSHGDGVSLGDVYRVSQVNPLSLPRKFTPQLMFEMGYSIVEPRHHALGALRFYDAAVTGAVNGTAFQITGGIPAGTQLIVNVHPYDYTGAASTVAHKIEADSANTFAATPQDFALTNMTNVLGGGTGGDAERLVIPATETDDWFRYVVTSVSAGTWSIAVTVALVNT